MAYLVLIAKNANLPYDPIQIRFVFYIQVRSIVW